MDPYPSSLCNSLSDPEHPPAWQLIKSSWQSKNRFPAYLFFAIVLCMTVTFVCVDMVFTYLYYHFYDVLTAHDKHGALRLLGVFIILFVCYSVIAAYRFYLAKLNGVRLQRFVAERYIGGWLLKRKGEEVGPLINFSIDLSLGLISIITTFIIFIYMLWQLVGDVNLSFGKWGNIELSRYVISIGFIYAVVGTLRTLKRGQSYFSARHILQQKPFVWFQTSFYQVSLILPLLVALPGYFDKIFLLSWLVQSLQSFTRVQASFSTIVNASPHHEIPRTEWHGSADKG